MKTAQLISLALACSATAIAASVPRSDGHKTLVQRGHVAEDGFVPLPLDLQEQFGICGAPFTPEPRPVLPPPRADPADCRLLLNDLATNHAHEAFVITDKEAGFPEWTYAPVYHNTCSLAIRPVQIVHGGDDARVPTSWAFGVKDAVQILGKALEKFPLTPGGVMQHVGSAKCLAPNQHGHLDLGGDERVIEFLFDHPCVNDVCPRPPVRA